MADSKLSALTAATPIVTDEVYLLDDPGGTPLSKKATVQGIIDLVPSASTTVEGTSELAIASEVNTGTDATRAITPDALAGSVLGQKAVQIVVVDYTTDTAVGDGKAYYYIRI